MNGQECPYNEYALRSVEGEVAWLLLVEGASQWVRGGMDGIVVGLDVGGCLSRPSAKQVDPLALEQLLSFGEIGAMAGFEKTRNKKD